MRPITNATDPNLEEFRRLGHKLIYYHGAADPLIPAQNGVNYFESVVAAQKGLEKTQSFYRAFLVPGLYHCAGGPGPTAFGTSGPAPESQRDADHDILRALQRWVETRNGARQGDRDEIHGRRSGEGRRVSASAVSVPASRDVSAAPAT